MIKTLYIVLFTSLIFSQSRINEFRSVSSFMNVRDIDFSEDFLVYASPAGIVEYDFQNKNYKTISFDDGISFGKIKKIHIDSTGNYSVSYTHLTLPTKA